MYVHCNKIFARGGQKFSFCWIMNLKLLLFLVVFSVGSDVFGTNAFCPAVDSSVIPRVFVMDTDTEQLLDNLYDKFESAKINSTLDL